MTDCSKFYCKNTEETIIVSIVSKIIKMEEYVKFHFQNSWGGERSEQEGFSLEMLPNISG